METTTTKLAGFCKTCLCFWKRKRGGWNTGELGNGTCMRDGSKTNSTWSCGYHSDIIEPEPHQISPDKRD